jgi:toxin ParE1/3/4
MNLPVILRPIAIQDIETTHAELETVRKGLGDRFVKRLRQILERIETIPELYALVWGDVRAARVRKFEHVVYLVILADRIDVFAVIHGSRDATSWQSRG